MRNERKIFYGIFAGIMAIAVIGAIFFPSTQEAYQENFHYLSGPAGAYVYKGEIKINDSASIPHITTVPRLVFNHKNFDRDDVEKIAELLGIRNGVIREYSDRFSMSNGDDSLTVYKNGYQIVYTKEYVEMIDVKISEKELVDIANEYLDKLEAYIPQNVDIKVHGVFNDRFEATTFDNGTTIETYYTKSIIYDCYFQGYFVGLKLRVEIDHEGNLVGFVSMPVKVTKNGEREICTFGEIHKWLRTQGLAVTVPPKLIKSVEIKDVKLGILPVPKGNSGEFTPAYIISVHIEGIDPVADDDYTLSIGGICR